jgi:hypothetical protein
MNNHDSRESYVRYSTRPKNSSNNYLIRVHAFDKLTLKHRVIVEFFNVLFLFLPVYRLLTLFRISLSNLEKIEPCLSSCIHGQYINNKTSSFCLCLGMYQYQISPKAFGIWVCHNPVT